MTPQDALITLQEEWNAAFPDCPVKDDFWTNPLEKFHPNVLLHKLAKVSTLSDGTPRPVVHPPSYFLSTMFDGDGYATQRGMNLQPLFRLGDDGLELIVPDPKFTRKQVRGMSRPRVIWVANFERGKIQKDPLPARRISGEIRKLRKVHQARVQNGEIYLDGATAHDLITRLIAA